MHSLHFVYACANWVGKRNLVWCVGKSFIFFQCQNRFLPPSSSPCFADRNLLRILIGQFAVTHGRGGGNNKPIIITIFYAKYFTVYLESEYLMTKNVSFIILTCWRVCLSNGFVCSVCSTYISCNYIKGYKSFHNLRPP